MSLLLEFTPPARRGSREQRREATLRALAAGDEARCAYCARPLPPLPPRGGRPTPYCAADAERYGQWGAKTITCAMLDEHREIWVGVYGPDQPMTTLDVHTLDERLSATLAVLDPVRAEITALQNRASAELTAALAAKSAAEADRDRALDETRAAVSDRDKAQADAHRAREQTEAARAGQAAAEAAAAAAEQIRDQAVTERNAARQDAETARTDRQSALDQVSTAHQRIAELQDALAAEHAAALERLDRLRHEEDQARGQLRTTLAEDAEQRLRAQAEHFTRRLEAAQTTADQRIADLTGRLAESTRAYAASLAPLHEKISTTEHRLAEQAAQAATARRDLIQLRSILAETLQQATDGTLRRHLQEALDHSAPTPRKTAPAPQPDPDTAES